MVQTPHPRPRRLVDLARLSFRTGHPGSALYRVLPYIQSADLPFAYGPGAALVPGNVLAYERASVVVRRRLTRQTVDRRLGDRCAYLGLAFGAFTLLCPRRDA